MKMAVGTSAVLFSDFCNLLFYLSMHFTVIFVDDEDCDYDDYEFTEKISPR